MEKMMPSSVRTQNPYPLSHFSVSGATDLHSTAFLFRVCACVWVWLCVSVGTCTCQAWCVEVGGQLQMSVPHLHPVWDRISYLRQQRIARLADPWASGAPPVSTPSLAVGTQPLQTCTTVPSLTWALGSELRASWLCGKCFAHWAISPAQIFLLGQDYFHSAVSRYSQAHHCNHFIPVLYGNVSSECGGINWQSIILLGKAPSPLSWTC